MSASQSHVVLPTKRDIDKIIQSDFDKKESDYHLGGYVVASEKYKFAMLKDHGFDPYDFVLKVHCLRFFQYLFGDVRGYELFLTLKERFIDLKHSFGDRDPKGKPLTSPRMVDVYEVLPSSALTADEVKIVEKFNEREWTEASLFEAIEMETIITHNVDSMNHHISQILSSLEKMPALIKMARCHYKVAGIKSMLDKLEHRDLAECTILANSLHMHNR